jgi:hypothetical protein
MSRLHNNKTFQAALAKQRDQANRLQRAQPQVNAVTSPRSGTALSPKDQALPRPSTSLQTTRAMAAQNYGTPDARSPALPTFSSPVQGKVSGDFTAKRLRSDPISPSQVKQRTESAIKVHAGLGTPVVERPLQPTPLTHIRPSNMQMQRDGDPGSPLLSFSSPHSLQNVSARPVQLPTTQPRSPPTPPRIVLDTAISRSLHKSPVSRQQMPVTLLQSSSFKIPCNGLTRLSRPAASSFFDHANRSSLSSMPQSIDPTPFCRALSSQQSSSLRVCAGFHNDGNTCYLRC